MGSDESLHEFGIWRSPFHIIFVVNLNKIAPSAGRPWDLNRPLLTVTYLPGRNREVLRMDDYTRNFMFQQGPGWMPLLSSTR